MAIRSFTTAHNYWGAFATTADLPNVAGADVQSDNLEAGDFAYISAPTSQHYRCTDPTAGAAVWEEMGGGGGGLTEDQVRQLIMSCGSGF